MLCENDEEPIDVCSDPSDIYEQCWTRELVSSVLDIFRATEPDTHFLELRIMEGQSIEQIASEANLPPAQVRTRVHRILKRFRKAVQYFIGDVKNE